MDCVLQVGACIVSRDKRILATGYNGMPWGCNDGALDWVKEGDGDYLYTETKTPYGKCLNVSSKVLFTLENIIRSAY